MKPIHAVMAVAAVLCMGSSAQAAEVIDAAIRQAYEEGYRAGYIDGIAGRPSSSAAPAQALPGTEFPASAAPDQAFRGTEFPTGAAPAGKPPASTEEWWEFTPQRGTDPNQPAAPGRPPAGINTGGFE
jgi:hypothetical protein